MARAYELAGDRLTSLPDGEIGERSDRYPAGDRAQWTAGLAGRLAGEVSLFDVVDEGTLDERGFPVDFDSTVRLRPKLDPSELAGRLRLGYDTWALRSWPHFERLREAVGRPDLRLQVGLPTGLGVAGSVLGRLRALRYAPAFAACLAREADAVAQAIGAGNLLFQIEAPAEVIVAHRLPRPAVGVPTGPVVDFARRLPVEVPIRDPPLLRRPRQHRADRPEPLRPPRRLRQRPGAPLAALSRTRLRPSPLRRRNLTGTHRSRRLPSTAQALPAVRHAPGRRIRPRGTAPGDARSSPSRHRASRRPPGRHSHRLRPRPP